MTNLPTFSTLSLMILLAHTAGAQWPCWRGQHADGVSREQLGTDWLDSDKLRVQWEAEVGIGFSSCVTNAMHVFTVGNVDEQDVVTCRDLSTGREIWQFGYPAPLDDRDFEGGPTSTPTLHNEMLFVLSREGQLHCLKQADGSVVYSKQLVDSTGIRIPGWGFGGSPRVFGDLLLIAMGEHGVAVQMKDGSVAWASADKEAGYATPAIYESKGKQYGIFASGRSFSGVDLGTGQPLWQTRWLTSFGCNAADPILHQGHVFLSSAYRRGAGLFDLSSGRAELKWKNKDMQAQLQSCILVDEKLYGIHGDVESGGQLRCMDFWTGTVQWTDVSIRAGALSATGKHLMVLTVDGTLHIAEASDTGFQSLASKSVLAERCWTVPVLDRGRLFCRDSSGTVVCVTTEPAE